MNHLLDSLIVGAIILGAAAYLLLRTFGRKKKSCGSCGCDSAKKIGVESTKDTK